ncbi:isochorismatase family protein [Candidatus Uabimicrobium sp. HlEnr_7]|uniref:isochorismatase family protein n=1 Tax=Candidatus Uabimicrobium helgolandensis TaxID=3095367 RepID=UPI0035573705
MSLLDVHRSIVVIIDLQGKLMDMIYRPNLVISSTIRLMKLADLFEVPVVITEQYPKGLGSTHPQVLSVYEKLTTKKFYMEKDSFGCCEDQFYSILKNARPDTNKQQIIIAGIEAHVCVMQTVIELQENGYEAHVCWECVSGRGEEYRDHALQRMNQKGAIITNHESVGFEWARDKNHPKFKEMSRLFREGQITS